MADEYGPVVGAREPEASRFVPVRAGRLGAWADPLRDNTSPGIGLTQARVDGVRAAAVLGDSAAEQRMLTLIPEWCPAGCPDPGAPQGFTSKSGLMAGVFTSIEPPSLEPRRINDLAGEVVDECPGVWMAWPSADSTGLQVVAECGEWDSNKVYRDLWHVVFDGIAEQMGLQRHLLASMSAKPKSRLHLSRPDELSSREWFKPSGAV